MNEERPHIESENICIYCKMPQDMPLNHKELCVKCFFKSGVDEFIR